MANVFESFERIARQLGQFEYAENEHTQTDHPFDRRNIHPALPAIVKRLFDNGHYSQATFEAFKYIDNEVARIAASSESGFKLMMQVFAADKSPAVQLTGCVSVSELDEQKGFQFLFAGSMLAIRNPRGHSYTINDSLDDCLDHLALASVLLRRLEAAGYSLTI